jgi:hypothetical protein
MFSALRRRLTYTNVGVTLALFFSMSGGALAAGHYLITSTKQIKPSVLSALKGKPGAAGANGATGVAGPAGPAGVAGAKGEAGPQGPQGPQGEPGKNGKNGTNGTTGFTATLPPERTETGTWSYSELAGAQVIASISFAIPLAKALEEDAVHWVLQDERTNECNGSAEKPEAAPGSLCVYEADDQGKTLLTTPVIIRSGRSIGAPERGASTAGALLDFGEAQETNENVRTAFGNGTWAVTAPEE